MRNLSHKNQQILDFVLQLPSVKIVPPISKRYGIFIIKNGSNSTKLKLPESYLHELIEANTGKTSVITSYKPILLICQPCRLKAKNKDPQENCSFHSYNTTTDMAGPHSPHVSLKRFAGLPNENWDQFEGLLRASIAAARIPADHNQQDRYLNIRKLI